MHPIRIALFALLMGMSGSAHAFEIFAKGSASKSYLAADSYVVSISGATGLAINLLPRVRLEGRYTNSSSLQNRMDISSGSLSGSLYDVINQSSIYSVGVDLDLLGPQAEFQPFIYVGVGYVEIKRSYYFLESGAPTSVYWQENPRRGVSANGGIGFRLRLAKSFAFEAEAFGYAIDIDKPDPLINMMGSIGVRIFM